MYIRLFMFFICRCCFTYNVTMTKKIILQINCQETCSCMNDITREQLLNMNDDMHKMITTYKNKITPYYNNRTWDKYKKLSNEFELIFTTPNTKSNVSLYNPVSRSFFKMWEIIYDFKNDVLSSMVASENNVKCLFLAEGPGGFLEAVMKYRSNKNDQYYGMTLRPDTKSIPEWKLKKFDMSNITTLYGADNTGNLYNLENTHYLEETLGKNSMDLITADGGFDFSSDFNNQEDQSMKLIRCEVYCALHLLKEDGSFILKIYDMFNHQTIHLMSILKQCFKTIHIIKPLTSRPANSEKYLLCTGYIMDNGREQIDYLKNLFLKKTTS
jgi:23S rRNA U2552 (ribose-2'-O)-methylase RlmE/FtsJ